MKTTYKTSNERGILTSAYKREINKNIASSRSETLSNLKTRIEDHHDRFQSQTGTILQLSLFAFALVLFIV